jgi:hypothetical protein
MCGSVPPLPNTPLWRGAQLKAQGQFYIHLYVISACVVYTSEVKHIFACVGLCVYIYSD